MPGHGWGSPQSTGRWGWGAQSRGSRQRFPRKQGEPLPQGALHKFTWQRIFCVCHVPEAPIPRRQNARPDSGDGARLPWRLGGEVAGSDCKEGKAGRRVPFKPGRTSRPGLSGAEGWRAHRNLVLTGKVPSSVPNPAAATLHHQAVGPGHRAVATLD